jgi:hypothetical protein
MPRERFDFLETCVCALMETARIAISIGALIASRS